MRASPHVVLTVIISQLAAYPISAQEQQAFNMSRFSNALPSFSSARSNGKSIGLAGEVTSDFDFDLGNDGVVIASTTSKPNGIKADQISLQYRNDGEQAPSQEGLPLNGKMGGIENSSSFFSLDPANNVECGPSPLKPSEIETLVVNTATKFGVDPNFAKAIAWTESRFDQRRNSPKGARGPMQLIPETAARFGVVDICDPVANIDGGVRYLKSLMAMFGNPLLAAAAYNAGENRVYEHHGVPPYAETVRYVADVVNYQMGLAAPARSSDMHASSQQQASKADTPDVIGATNTAKFVGGVMQF